MKRWRGHDAHAAQCADRGRFPDTDAVLHELVGGGWDIAQSGCAICWLRDTLDRERTIQWLTARRRIRHRALDAVGAACCPLHAWRLCELVATSAPSIASSSSSASPSWTESVGDTASPADKLLHTEVAGLLFRTIETLHHDLLAMGERFSQTGLRDQLVRLRGDVPPGLLWLCPDCPICKQAEHRGQRHVGRLAETNRPSGESERQMSLLHVSADEIDAGIFAEFARLYAALPSARRRVVAEHLCPHDRRRSYLSIRQFVEFPPPTRYLPAGTLPRLPQWWIAPAAGMEDRSFVARLLCDDIPDVECPACWVRAEHEAALIAEVRDAVAADAQRGEAIARNVSSGESPGTGESVTRFTGILDDVCPRHMALLCDTRGAAVPLVPLVAQASGSLRARCDDACVVCAVVNGWDLARLEGLRRAAGGALLYEDETQRLQQVLATRQHGLCLPHWQKTTATAEREVTRTLLDLQLRSVGSLRAALARHADTQQITQSACADESTLTTGPDPRIWATLALAGHPA